MRGLNKVTLIGNLGTDPDYQQLDGNIAVTKLTVATTETYKGRSVKHNTKQNGIRWSFGEH